MNSMEIKMNTGKKPKWNENTLFITTYILTFIHSLKNFNVMLT